MKAIYIGLLLGAALLARLALADAAPGAWQPPGPEVGQAFPDVLQLPDATGRPRSLPDLMGTRGLTVVFVRSADWCPFCQRQLRELNRRADAFAAAGFPLVSVSVDDVHAVASFADALPSRFAMLADRDARATDALGIRDPRYPVGTARFGVPQSGIFVVDRTNTVVGKFFVAGYKERPDPDIVLAFVVRFASPSSGGTR